MAKGEAMAIEIDVRPQLDETHTAALAAQIRAIAREAVHRGVRDALADLSRGGCGALTDLNNLPTEPTL